MESTNTIFFFSFFFFFGGRLVCEIWHNQEMKKPYTQHINKLWVSFFSFWCGKTKNIQNQNDAEEAFGRL